MKVRKTVRFSAAHLLPHHSGRCQNLHGHNYNVTVWIEGDERQNGRDPGMVVDFGDLRRMLDSTIDPLDHKFLVAKRYVTSGEDQPSCAIRTCTGGGIIVPTGMVKVLPIEEITAECLARYIGERLVQLMGNTTYHCVRVDVEETEGSVATWEYGT